MLNLKTSALISLMTVDQIEELSDGLADGLCYTVAGKELKTILNTDFNSRDEQIGRLVYVLANLGWYEIQQTVIDGHFAGELDKFLRLMFLSPVLEDHRLLNLLDDDGDWDKQLLQNAGAAWTGHSYKVLVNAVHFDVYSLRTHDGLPEPIYFYSRQNETFAHGPFLTHDEACEAARSNQGGE